jgi:hypothetical protein
LPDTRSIGALSRQIPGDSYADAFDNATAAGVLNATHSGNAVHSRESSVLPVIVASELARVGLRSGRKNLPDVAIV